MKKIKYYLLDNPFTPDPGDRRAQIFDYEVIEEDELFTYVAREGSGFTLAEIKASYEAITEGYDYFLKRGCGFNTAFLKTRPVIQGVYHGDDDKFDSNRHTIKHKASLGSRFNHAADDVKVEKVTPPSNSPLPATLEDITSDTVNESLTPGGTAILNGIRLKFNQDDAQQGIFLIDSAKNEYRVEKILSHTGAKVVFLLPATLASDEYSLEVRMLPPNNKNVKTGKLTERLTV